MNAGTGSILINGLGGNTQITHINIDLVSHLISVGDCINTKFTKHHWSQAVCCPYRNHELVSHLMSVVDWVNNDFTKTCCCQAVHWLACPYHTLNHHRKWHHILGLYPILPCSDIITWIIIYTLLLCKSTPVSRDPSPFRKKTSSTPSPSSPKKQEMPLPIKISKKPLCWGEGKKRKKKHPKCHTT